MIILLPRIQESSFACCKDSLTGVVFAILYNEVAKLAIINLSYVRCLPYIPYLCIYAILGRVICGPDEDFAYYEAQGALLAMIRLRRQVSYFGDAEGLNRLMAHIGNKEVNFQVLLLL